MEINKGPDWTAAQSTAAAIGFFASAAVAHLLNSQGYATGKWPVILIAIGLALLLLPLRAVWRAIRRGDEPPGA